MTDASDGIDRKRGVRLSADEAWDMLQDAHTGIFTTLRADGYPIALPLWYAALDRKIYLSSRGKKLGRIRRDSRASFLIEGGEQWKDLWAVHLTGDVRIIEPDADLSGRMSREIARKYAKFRTADENMPTDTRDHYAKSAWATVEFTPHDRILSWDNRRLGVTA